MKRLTVKEFGHRLLDTEDLDPVYVMLARAELEQSLLKRWLLAYWWFYHSGVACRVAESSDFYGQALALASLKGGARGTERRHFRGKACINSVSWFQKNYPEPDSAIDFLIGGANSFRSVLELACGWPMFGPWIGFKIADMLERVLEIAVDFSDCKLLDFYSEPAKGAALAAKELNLPSPEAALSALLEEFRQRKAPPRYDRDCGLQEVETVLCKWKSHCNGHYPAGKDIRELLHSLEGWGPLADRMTPHVMRVASDLRRQI